MATVHNIMGYKVVLNKTNIQRISVESAVNAGFLHETRETAGINHLLEHVLTEGWQKCGTSCSEFWSTKGVRMNASTDETIMMYYVKGLVEDLAAMVQYIAAITTHPIMHKTTVVKEKQAVIDELLTYGSEPSAKLDSALNHILYQNGLEYKDDWKLQIQNLKKLSLKDIQKVYLKEFTPANVVFVVSGAFSPSAVIAHFRKALPHQTVPIGQRIDARAFTWTHEIRYVPDEMATSLVVLAIPSEVYADSVLVPVVTAVLGDILFNELRTKRQLVYGVHVNSNTTTCGTLLQFKIYVRPTNLVECLRVLVAQVNQCLHGFPEARLTAVKKRMRQKYAVSVPDAEFYATQHVISPDFIISVDALQEVYAKATVSAVVQTMRTLIHWEHAACVYEGQKDIALTWAKIGIL